MDDQQLTKELRLGGGILRKQCCDWWIKYFKNLRDAGLFCDDDIVHRKCLKFCFMDLLQMDKVARDLEHVQDKAICKPRVSSWSPRLFVLYPSVNPYPTTQLADIHVG